MTSLRSVCELFQLRDGLLTCPHTFWQGEVEREAVEGDEERGDTGKDDKEGGKNEGDGRSLDAMIVNTVEVGSGGDTPAYIRAHPHTSTHT